MEVRDERRHVRTASGDIAYTDVGEGPPALFVHGVLLNGSLWRPVIDQVSDLRRCVAIDLLGHGATRAAPGASPRFDAQAEMLAQVCDALGLDTVDLVANDSGGGIAQIFAARHPQRLRSLTLTNCDVHDNWPPPALQPLLSAVAAGQLGALGQRMLSDIGFARQSLAMGYEHPERLSAETVHGYLEPLFATPQSVELLERFFNDMDNGQTTSIQPQLQALELPTLIVWGTGDIFFDVAWAHWLADTIPGARAPILVEGAKLFFPEERPEALVAALRPFWTEGSARP